MIVGMDHGLSFPLSYFEETTPVKPAFHDWMAFMHHFDAIWGGVKERPVSSIAAPTLPYGNPWELRLTEKFTSPPAKSVLNLNPTLISVAFSTHAGLPWLYELRRRYADVLHVWPFDGLVPVGGRSVIAEAYPSLFYNRYEYPPELTKRDEKDAYAVSLMAARTGCRRRAAAVHEPADVDSKPARSRRAAGGLDSRRFIIPGTNS